MSGLALITGETFILVIGGIRPRINTVISLILKTWTRSMRPLFIPRFVRKHWYGVHPQGELTPCGRDWDAETSFGSVHDYNDCEEIKNHPHFVAFRRKTDQLLKYCQDSGCPFFYACFSGCPGINYSYDARMEKPEPNHCQATQEILSHVYETIKHIDIARDATKYNPHFMRILTDVGFRSIDFIKQGVTGTINHEG